MIRCDVNTDVRKRTPLIQHYLIFLEFILWKLFPELHLIIKSISLKNYDYEKGIVNYGSVHGS